MKDYRAALLLIPVFGAAAPLGGQSVWAYVPASPDIRAVDEISVPGTPTDNIVNLVGGPPTAASRPREPRRVISVDISTQPAAPSTKLSPVPSGIKDIPAGALWPDASGRIAPSVVVPIGSSKTAAIRNPWEVRVRAERAGTETRFACGGIIEGGEGGPIGILNGRIVRHGDNVGRFSVAGVMSAGIILERDGSYFVVPCGARTTISTIDG